MMKNKKKEYLEKISRPMPSSGKITTRSDKIRLDKNECLDEKLINYFYKEIFKKIDSNYLSIYPETSELYLKLAKRLKLKVDNREEVRTILLKMLDDKKIKKSNIELDDDFNILRLGDYSLDSN